MIKHKFKLGDAVAKITKILRIPHCDKCEQRRLILNEIQVLGLRETVKKLRATGLSIPTDMSEKGKWSKEDIRRKLEDCCGERNKES